MSDGDLWDKVYEIEKGQEVVKRDIQDLIKDQHEAWQAIRELTDFAHKIRVGQAVLQTIIGVVQAVGTAAITAWVVSYVVNQGR